MKTYSRFILESYGARDLLENAAEDLANLNRQLRDALRKGDKEAITELSSKIRDAKEQERLTTNATEILNTNRETENPKRPTATPTYVNRSGIIQDLSSQGPAEAPNPHLNKTPQERGRPSRQRPAQNPNRPITTRNQIL